MKKLSFIFASIVPILGALALTACDDGEPSTPTTYDISYTEDDRYTVSELETEAEEGDLVNFKVESNSVFYEIDKVSFNGTTITEDEFGYSFTMPAEDVTITIDLTPITEYDDPDDYLSWDDSVLDEISTASDSDKEVSWDVEQTLALDFDMAKFGSYNTEIDAEFLSSNEGVIPASALSFEAVTGNMDNLIKGGNIIVDLKQINPGTASIYFSFDSNNASEAHLIRTFTVTEYGKIELDTIEPTFEVENNTKYDDVENITISFTDLNYVYGSNAPEYKSVTLEKVLDANYQFTITYALGHSYQISANYSVWNEEEGKYDEVVSLDVLDWATGSSVTGFNQIKDGVLTLVSLPTSPIKITLDD